MPVVVVVVVVVGESDSNGDWEVKLQCEEGREWDESEGEGKPPLEHGEGGGRMQVWLDGNIDWDFDSASPLEGAWPLWHGV
jgi:hypothetical protein